MTTSPFKRKATSEPSSPPKIPDLQDPSEGVVKWFINRGISSQTIQLAGVQSGEAYIGGERKKAIAFVHKDCKGKVINVKFRSRDKQFSQIKNGSRLPYLWNMIDLENPQ